MRETILRLARKEDSYPFNHAVMLGRDESVVDFLARMPWGDRYTLLAIDGVSVLPRPADTSVPMRMQCAACGYAYGDHDGEDCPKQQGKFRRHGEQIKTAPERDPSAERDAQHVPQPAFTPTLFNPFEGFEVQYTFDAGGDLFGSSNSIWNVEREVPLQHPLQRAKGL